MSYQPQVGDQVRRAEWIDEAWINVLHIDGRDLFARTNTGTPRVEILDGYWHKVEPRPTIEAEQWGYIYDATYFGQESKNRAYATVKRLGPDATLARIIDGRVCYEDETPAIVEPKS